MNPAMATLSRALFPELLPSWLTRAVCPATLLPAFALLLRVLRLDFILVYSWLRIQSSRGNMSMSEEPLGSNNLE